VDIAREVPFIVGRRRGKPCEGRIPVQHAATELQLVGIPLSYGSIGVVAAESGIPGVIVIEFVLLIETAERQVDIRGRSEQERAWKAVESGLLVMTRKVPPTELDPYSVP